MRILIVHSILVVSKKVWPLSNVTKEVEVDRFFKFSYSSKSRKSQDLRSEILELALSVKELWFEIFHELNNDKTSIANLH